MDEPTISRRLVLGTLGLTGGLSLLFLAAVNHRARSSFEQARSLLAEVDAALASAPEVRGDPTEETPDRRQIDGWPEIEDKLRSAARLLDRAEEGLLPEADLLFLRAEVALGFPDPEIEHAADLCRRGLEQNPFHGKGHLMLASLWAQLEDHEASREQSARVVQAAPYHRDLLLRVAETHFYRWMDGGDADELDEAIRLLARVNAISPELIPRTLPLVELADDRTETLRRIIPDTLAGHTEFAGYLAEINRLEEGLEELEVAFQSDECTDAIRIRGYLRFSRLLEKEGRLEEAINILEKARFIEGEREFRGERARARLLLALGRVDDAKKSLIRALRKGKDREQILVETFTSLKQAGALPRSLDLWRALEDEFPFFEQPKYFLALTLLELGEEQESIKVLQQYVLRQGDVKALEVLSRLMIKQKQWRLALQYIERARIYSPDDEKFASLERTLKEKIGTPTGRG